MVTHPFNLTTPIPSQINDHFQVVVDQQSLSSLLTSLVLGISRALTSLVPTPLPLMLAACGTGDPGSYPNWLN